MSKKLSESYYLLTRVKEVLFNKYLTILFISISNICFPLENDIHLYDFVHLNVTPLEISQNNIGFRSWEVDEEISTFIYMQRWFSNNLYFNCAISPSSSNEISLIYNLNFGYKIRLDFLKLKNLYFDIGYYSKRFESNLDNNSRWKSFSLTSDFQFKKIFFLPSYTYIFNTNNDEKDSNIFLSIDFIKILRQNFFIKFGAQIYDENDIYVLPFISLNYKI